MQFVEIMEFLREKNIKMKIDLTSFLVATLLLLILGCKSYSEVPYEVIYTDDNTIIFLRSNYANVNPNVENILIAERAMRKHAEVARGEYSKGIDHLPLQIIVDVVNKDYEIVFNGACSHVSDDEVWRKIIIEMPSKCRYQAEYNFRESQITNFIVVDVGSE